MTELKMELKNAVADQDFEGVRKHFDKSDLDCNRYGLRSYLLHYTATRGTLEIVQFLVENGADINQRGGTFSAPTVTYAAEQGNLDIVRYLVESGSDLCNSASMANALLISAERGHPDVVEYLISAGVDPHITEGTEKSAVISVSSMF